MNGKYRTTGIELLLNFIVLPSRCQDFFPATAEKIYEGLSVPEAATSSAYSLLTKVVPVVCCV
jgi:hypothetical protein